MRRRGRRWTSSWRRRKVRPRLAPAMHLQRRRESWAVQGAVSRVARRRGRARCHRGHAHRRRRPRRPRRSGRSGLRWRNRARCCARRSKRSGRRSSASTTLRSTVLRSTAVLATLLPPAGARNAVDCALWDLTAKQRAHDGVGNWRGLTNPRRLTTSITLGIDTDEAVAAGARRYAGLAADQGEGRRRASRSMRCAWCTRHCPAAGLIVDPNQAWTCDLLNRAGARNEIARRRADRAAGAARRGRDLARLIEGRYASPPMSRWPTARDLAAGQGSVPGGERQARQDRRAHRGARAGAGRPRIGTCK